MDSSEVFRNSWLSQHSCLLGNCIYKIHLQALFSRGSRRGNFGGFSLRIIAEAEFPLPQMSARSPPPSSWLAPRAGGGDGRVCGSQRVTERTQGAVVQRPPSLLPRAKRLGVGCGLLNVNEHQFDDHQCAGRRCEDDQVCRRLARPSEYLLTDLCERKCIPL